MTEPSREDIASFERFVEGLSKAAFSPGTWHRAEEIEPGHYTWPHWEPSAVVREWHDALCDLGVVDSESDYLSEEFGRYMEGLTLDSSGLSSASLATTRAVLTYIVRGDRFCDGQIIEMFEKGVAQAATIRLAQLGRDATPKQAGSAGDSPL